MRLWHQSLISKLPRQQLLGQHRECCALRGKGWGRKHATVDYVFTHSPEMLFAYHRLIMEEMKNRGYHPDGVWKDPCWRGSVLGKEENWIDPKACGGYIINAKLLNEMIYPEHNDAYLKECLDNLKSKGIEIEI